MYWVAFSLESSPNFTLSIYEVKMRGPIPASKKWGSETNPRVQKIMLWDQSLRLLVLWSQNSIFSAGIESQSQKLLPLGSDAKF